MENIAENFSEVLRGTRDRAAIVKDIVKLLENEKKFISINVIIIQIKSIDEVSASFIKQAVNVLVKEEILIKQDNSSELKVMLSETNSEKIESFIDNTFGEDHKTPSEVIQHFEEYGFEELVNSVSKQINHDNVLVKEFDYDRLMLGRYIDFLKKAERYMSWFKSDQAIAKKKIAELRKLNKKSKQ